MQVNVDRIAGMLADAAQRARKMPPCWDGGGISTPLVGPDGQWLGRVLPGRGVLLGADLKRVGITRAIPHVYERTPYARLRDHIAARMPTLAGQVYYHRGLRRMVDPERGAITTYDGIINARANGKAEDIVISKVAITAVAQAFSTMFGAGGQPVAGTYTNIPGGAVMTRASVGAWSQGFSDPGTDLKYLLTFGFGSTAALDWGILIDLLVACGNISASIATSQTINSVAQTRQYGATLGAGVMATLAITTALGTGTGTFTLTSYTDQDGNAAAASQSETSAASTILHRLIPTGAGSGAFPWIGLASGDYGVRSVETFAFSAAHSAGVLALYLAVPLAYVPGIAANLYTERDSTVQIDGIKRLEKDGSNVIGCLTMLVQANGVSSGGLRAFFRSCAG